MKELSVGDLVKKKQGNHVLDKGIVLRRKDWKNKQLGKTHRRRRLWWIVYWFALKREKVEHERYLEKV